MPPLPLERTKTYPEDQEHEENKTSVDSSLSIEQVVARVADEAPGELVDFLDEDEGVDGFIRKGTQGLAHVLEPFNPQLATSHWPRWDGKAIAHRITHPRILNTKDFTRPG